MALTGTNDSWSADIVWQHDPESEQINLSGPLGQGAVSIRLDGDLVTIARGDADVEMSDQPELFIEQQLGLAVPVRALRYWVIGLPSPQRSFSDLPKGFSQDGWMVDYPEIQQVQGRAMPRKIFVQNAGVKLKLIVDQWNINGNSTR